MANRRSPLFTAIAIAGLLGTVAGGRAWAQAVPAVSDTTQLASSRIELPDGGVIWASEDPAITAPVLGLQSAGMVPVENGRIAAPVNFHAYTNYPAFIERLEVAIFAGSDSDLVEPVAIMPVPVGSTAEAKWDGALPEGLVLQPGDTLLYVARAWGKDGAFDVTLPRRIQLVTAADYARGLQSSRERVRKTLGEELQGDAAQSLETSDAVYGRGSLRRQNIAVRGSRVRITSPKPKLT